MATSGGRFDFDDGGTYCGGWEDGRAHGVGICTGPKGQGEYAGAYNNGFEISGVYKWSTGSSYKGQWTQGKRHGLGVENKGRWLYQGEWTQGFKGRYGIRTSLSTGAKFEGTWTTGLQDGYGVETYGDGGTYQGQWLRGIRHGYGVRQSIPYGLATLTRNKVARESMTSLRSEPEDDQTVKERERKLAEMKGGFVLTSSRLEARTTNKIGLHLSKLLGKRSASADPSRSGRSSLRKTLEGLKLGKQKSQEMDERRNTGSNSSYRSWSHKRNHEDSQTLRSAATSCNSLRQSPLKASGSESIGCFWHEETIDLNAVECYAGEWKNDKRSGFGVSSRTDGLKYEGEWDNNCRHGYGATTFKDGTKEEGKYKNNVLMSSGKKGKLLALRANKVKEHVTNAIAAAQRASQIAIQKAEIAVSRMMTSRGKAELALQAASKAQSDAEKAKVKAMEYAPEFMEEMNKKESAALSLLALGSTTGITSSSSTAATAAAAAAKYYQQATTTQKRHQDATASFVSQFTEHYNMDHQPNYVQKKIQQTNPVKKPPIQSLYDYSSTPPQQNNQNFIKNQNINPNQHQPPFLPTPIPSSNLEEENKEFFENNKLSSELVDNQFISQKKRFNFRKSKLKSMQQINMKLQNKGTPSSTSDSFDQSEANMNLAEVSDSKVEINDEKNETNNKVSENGDVSAERMEDFFDQYQPKGGAYNFKIQQLRQQQKQLQPSFDQQVFQQQNVPQNNKINYLYTDNQQIFSYDNPRQQLQPQNNIKQEYIDEYHPPYLNNNLNELNQLNDCSLERRQTLPAGQLQQKSLPQQKQNYNFIPPKKTQFPSQQTKNKQKNILGSMPNINKYKNQSLQPEKPQEDQAAIPREEVHFMSLKRREELRKMREEEESRRQQDIVLSLSEMKNWCQQRQLFVLLIALNIGLAAMFFNLLSR